MEGEDQQHLLLYEQENEERVRSFHPQLMTVLRLPQTTAAVCEDGHFTQPYRYGRKR